MKKCIFSTSLLLIVLFSCSKSDDENQVIVKTIIINGDSTLDNQPK